jgi:16S rRNA (adenine1518-N6/adenine1519-N6)-dimethyltransferase
MGERLGQHFLLNPEIARKIADIVSPGTGDKIVEIGPGKGFLTGYLINKGAEITAIEIDKNLALHLKDSFSGLGLKIINEDFLKVNLDELGFNKICGNIPYQISGKIIEKIIRSGQEWVKCVLMIPEAIAVRIVANPGDSEYSALSVLCQATNSCRLELIVNRDEFDPQPKIESAVVSFRRSSPPLPENFYKFVHAAFRLRRKNITNSLKGCLSVDINRITEILQACGVDPNLRAQDIDINSFKILSKEFENKGIM